MITNSPIFIEHILRIIDLIYKTPFSRHEVWLFIVIYIAVVLWNAVPQWRIQKRQYLKPR